MRNQVTMVGRLGKDAAITKFENGSIVARFPIAVEQGRKTLSAEAPDSPPKANFYSMFAWGNTANFINEFCKKGSKLAVTGRLVSRTYFGRNGSPVKVTEIEVRQVVLL